MIVYNDILFLIHRPDTNPNQIQALFAERMATSSIPHAKIPLVEPPKVFTPTINQYIQHKSISNS